MYLIPRCTVPFVGRTLYEVAAAAEGFSGRALRKLPLMAHAFFVKKRQTDYKTFLRALHMAVLKETKMRENMMAEDLTTTTGTSKAFSKSNGTSGAGGAN